MPVTFLVMTGSKFTILEKLFFAIAWSPKVSSHLHSTANSLISGRAGHPVFIQTCQVMVACAFSLSSYWPVTLQPQHSFGASAMHI